MQKITIEITIEQAYAILNAFAQNDQEFRIPSDPPDEEQDALEALIRGELEKAEKADHPSE